MTDRCEELTRLMPLRDGVTVLVKRPNKASLKLANARWGEGFFKPEDFVLCVHNETFCAAWHFKDSPSWVEFAAQKLNACVDDACGSVH